MVDRDRRFEVEALPHMRSLYGTAYRIMGNAHDAEDVVQETYLRAYRAFDRYTPGTNIRAWLFTILHRVRTDVFRRRGRSPATVELVDDGPAVAPAAEKLFTGGEDVERAFASEELAPPALGAAGAEGPAGVQNGATPRGRGKKVRLFFTADADVARLFQAPAAGISVSAPAAPPGSAAPCAGARRRPGRAVSRRARLLRPTGRSCARACGPPPDGCRRRR